MSLALFCAIASMAPAERAQRPAPLPTAFSYISPRARLAAEESLHGFCLRGPRLARVSLRVGLTARGQMRLPTADGELDWQGREMGYPPRRILVRELRVCHVAVPACLGWWLARCRAGEAVSLVVLVERPPGLVELPAPAFTEGLVALRIDTTGTADGPVGEVRVFLDCEAALPALRHARWVALAGRTARLFRHLPALARLPALRVLTLALADLPGVAWVGQCRALRVLQLSGCLARTSLAPLSSLHNLHIASLEACDVRDLCPLADIRSLRVLRVFFSPFVADLGVVGRLPHLEVVDVQECCRLTNVDGLHGAPRVRWVSLRGTPVSEIGALATLPSLRYMDCASCDKLLHLPALREVPHLYEVVLTRSAVMHLDGLLGCESLQRVAAAHCFNLSSLAGLRGATELVELDVSDTPVASLDALAGAVLLRVLRAHSTAVGDLDCLATCPRLEHVDVHSCQQLVRVGGLRGLRELRFMDVRRCPEIRDLDVLSSLTAVRAKGLRVLQDA